MKSSEVFAWILNWKSNSGIYIFVKEMCTQFLDEEKKIPLKYVMPLIHR